MLTATEDLLDSWPGTLIVVSHDRYLLERVTDQQYAILDGRLRHLPGGVEEYLRLAAEPRDAPAARTAPEPVADEALSGAELRAVEKEIASIDRSLAKLSDRIAAKHQELADHDQSDHVGLAALTEQLRALEAEVEELESRWLELSDKLS